MVENSSDLVESTHWKESSTMLSDSLYREGNKIYEVKHQPLMAYISATPSVRQPEIMRHYAKSTRCEIDPSASLALQIAVQI